MGGYCFHVQIPLLISPELYSQKGNAGNLFDVPFPFQICVWAGRKEGGREWGKGERQGTNGWRKEDVLLDLKKNEWKQTFIEFCWIVPGKVAWLISLESNRFACTSVSIQYADYKKLYFETYILLNVA